MLLRHCVKTGSHHFIRYFSVGLDLGPSPNMGYSKINCMWAGIFALWLLCDF